MREDVLTVDQAGTHGRDLVEQGGHCLALAVEGFDIHKGHRFSTYATLALMKGFARSVPTMLSRILDAVDEVRFQRLIAIGQLLHAFIGGILDCREVLRISRLSGAGGANLSGILSQFVRLCLFIPTRSLHHEFPPCSRVVTPTGVWMPRGVPGFSVLFAEATAAWYCSMRSAFVSHNMRAPLFPRDFYCFSGTKEFRSMPTVVTRFFVPHPAKESPRY